ncbi:amino acid ABC transporter permease [Kiloniella laminariae]|uniref:Amino acid ABC transporter permease n=1 Tax=Kiloniella laminariae TaxID=454162 RepID=A0ABT4LP46_9PROT|nr:amino acid ABC transporter permease [Kiloniella laminariae]MCZ4282905.1 amino acid ABC transporter permease [Kiloniella laminariae]
MFPLALSACGGSYTWGWHVVDPSTPQGWDNISFLVGGLFGTVKISVIAIFLSMLIGLAISLPGLSSNKALLAFNLGYVSIFRSIPVLVMVLWIYYGLPVILGLEMSVFMAGIVALALCDSAFQAEIFRGGIQSIEIGQHEAADSMGLSYFQKMRLIILPQAIRRIIPPLGNQFVYMLKMSSLVSVIGYSDLTRRANELTVNEYRPLEIYSFLILEYLLLILLVAYAIRKVEKRLQASEEKQNHPPREVTSSKGMPGAGLEK